MNEWKKDIYNPIEDGDMQLFANWKRGKTEIEVTRYYDEDNGKYDEDYSVFEQLEYDDKSGWKGTELGTFPTLQEALDYAQEVVDTYEDKNA